MNDDSLILSPHNSHSLRVAFDVQKNLTIGQKASGRFAQSAR